MHDGQPTVTSVFYVAAMCSFVNLMLVLFFFPDSTDKRKAKAAQKAAAEANANAPKSTEVLAWEQKVADQGNVVRELKAKPKREESDKAIAEAVEELKKLKAELAELSKKQSTA